MTVYHGHTGLWHIQYAPPPIPKSCGCDYQFWHDEYDGSGDLRQGHGASVEQCMDRIDDMEEI